MPPQVGTALDLITDALVEIGALASGETPTAADAALGLRRLQALVDAWAAERLTMASAEARAFLFVPGQAWYTVGPGGDFDLPARPAAIEAVSVLLPPDTAPIEQALELLTDQRWQQADKFTQTGVPWAVYNDFGEPALRLNYLGTPTLPGLRTILYLPVAFDGFVDLSTYANLGAGLREALVYNLALRLSEPFTRPLSAAVVRQAGASLARLKRRNAPRRELGVDPAFRLGGGTRGRSDIRTGEA